jgi:hypothetical protein
MLSSNTFAGAGLAASCSLCSVWKGFLRAAHLQKKAGFAAFSGA